MAQGRDDLVLIRRNDNLMALENYTSRICADKLSQYSWQEMYKTLIHHHYTNKLDYTVYMIQLMTQMERHYHSYWVLGMFFVPLNVLGCCCGTRGGGIHVHTYIYILTGASRP